MSDVGMRIVEQRIGFGGLVFNIFIVVMWKKVWEGEIVKYNTLVKCDYYEENFFSNKEGENN